MPLDRKSAFQLVLEKIGEGNLLSHILAVEAGMRAVAARLGEDIESYGMVGLLHDLDYNETKDDHARHTYLTREWLTPYLLPESWLYAIEAHPGHVPCKSTMDWSLYAVDPTTGFLVAASRMHPSKTLAGLDSEFLLRRFNEKRFAAGANREAMASCSQLGFELSDFLLLVRDGMLTIPIRKIAE